MPTQKADLLKAISFGNWVAEHERKELQTYFLTTPTFRMLAKNDRDIVLGPPGSGKTALLFALVDDHKGEATDRELARNIVRIQIANPVSEAAFVKYSLNQLGDSEVAFRHTWCLLFASETIATLLRRNVPIRNLLPLAIQLRRLGVLNARLYSLRDIYEQLLKLLRMFRVSFEPEDGAIVFGTPDASGTSPQRLAIADVLRKIDEFLRSKSLEVWICLDRLDACFPMRSQTEQTAIRALLTAYNDLPGQNLRAKIFLRDDIWAFALGDGDGASGRGMRQLPHLTARSVDLTWHPNEIRHLLLRRILANKGLLTFLGLKEEPGKIVPEEVYETAFSIFPPRIGAENLLGWADTHLRDGKGRYGPREVIYLFAEALHIQQRMASTAEYELPGKQLIDQRSFELALPAVSRDCLQSRLLAEHSWAQPHIEKLTGGNIRHSVEQLAATLSKSQEEAEEIGTRLVNIGFFRRTGGTVEPFEIARIYQPALNMGRFG